jgi:hypothetical protein
MKGSITYLNALLDAGILARLTTAQIRVLMHLVLRTSGLWYGRIETLETLTGICDTVIYELFGVLVESGFLVKEKPTDGRNSAHYRLSFPNGVCNETPSESGFSHAPAVRKRGEQKSVVTESGRGPSLSTNRVNSNKHTGGAGEGRSRAPAKRVDAAAVEALEKIGVEETAARRLGADLRGDVVQRIIQKNPKRYNIKNYPGFIIRQCEAEIESWKIRQDLEREAAGRAARTARAVEEKKAERKFDQERAAMLTIWQGLTPAQQTKVSTEVAEQIYPANFAPQKAAFIRRTPGLTDPGDAILKYLLKSKSRFRLP